MNYPDFIEDLIVSKTYEELTASERQMVGEWISTAQEYTTIKQLLTELNQAVEQTEETQVPVHIKANLQKSFASKYAQKNKITALRWRTIAITSIAASIALVVYVGVLFTQNNPKSELAQNTTPAPAPTPKVENSKSIENQSPLIEKPIIPQKVEEQKMPSLPPPVTEEVVINRDFVEDMEVKDEVNTRLFEVKKNITIDSPKEIVQATQVEKIQQETSSEGSYFSLDNLQNFTLKEVKGVSVNQNADLLQLTVTVY